MRRRVVVVDVVLPEGDVESGHVVGDVAVKVDEHGAGLADQFGHSLNLVQVVANHPGVDGA